MSKNYTAIHYIQNQLRDFNSKFVNCAIRCFNCIEKVEEPDGCLSNSVVLFICAKEYGYDPVLCYGLCQYDGKKFYHTWLEVNGIVIDIAIYGNVNFSPFLAGSKKLTTPYIGEYKNADIHYGKHVFDDDWPYSLLAKMEGMTFEHYMDGLPKNAMWKITCKYLDKTPTVELVNHLRMLIKENKI